MLEFVVCLSITLQFEIGWQNLEINLCFLKDSDALHWGEGKVSVSADVISFHSKLAPGPDYKLYLSPVFVETEADFKRLKANMARVGDIKTFDNFVVSVPAGIDTSKYSAVIIWCERFSQFITAASYK
ncbi:MAG: DM13 domain-containing protein [Burkholderiales bacterium]|nr:DM13 domain-containing protein [Burkholderiales bacterium]MCA3162230.1 DM13 domain-containing protein [Burkholderiales bacterium]MCA3164017.1 DM13 domain-containing protein [Burkholderiales bacterium]MCA3165522.1 DM13 domain-containing protein [Burkholderiales bacterium]MCA3171135.1 DM13 domain-containing protein [Burkholderiales bacterium]